MLSTMMMWTGGGSTLVGRVEMLLCPREKLLTLIEVVFLIIGNLYALLRNRSNSIDWDFGDKKGYLCALLISL